MEFRIVHINRPEREEQIERDRRDRVDYRLRAIMELLMALSPQVAAVLAEARKLDNVVDAVNAGFATLSKQVVDLKDQIVNQTPSLSEEDKTALSETLSELQENVARMPQNIVAGTGQTGTDGNTGVVPPAPEVPNDPAPPTPTEELMTTMPASNPEATPAGGSQGENTGG